MYVVPMVNYDIEFRCISVPLEKKRNYKYYAQIKGLMLSALKHGVEGIPFVPMVWEQRKE